MPFVMTHLCIAYKITQSTYDFISEKDKQFIIAFDEAIKEIGYESGGSIGNGYCWGRYMIIYAKIGVKDKKVAARIYIRDNGIVLRLFFNKIDKHRGYIENTNEFIRFPFVSDHGNCHYCPNKKNDICKFRKTYTIGNRRIEKCSGVTFEFEKPDTDKLPDYMALLREFYPVRKGG
jgi:hypothetical protein